MKKIGPGYNEDGWSGEAQCVSRKGKRMIGCGARLEVEKSDLFTVRVDFMGDQSKGVAFVCPCGIENGMPNGELFTDLPSKEEWMKRQAANQP